MFLLKNTNNIFGSIKPAKVLFNLAYERLEIVGQLIYFLGLRFTHYRDTNEAFL